VAENPEKVREIGLRRAAARQDLALQRARVRDRRAVRYGTYQLVDLEGNAVFAAEGGYGKTLDEIEAHLNHSTD